VQLDVQFDDPFTDLVADRADVGFRGGSPPAEGAIARRLLPIQLIVCASPAYLARHGTPRTIEALDAHRCTGYRRVKAFIDFMVERLADNQDFFLTRAELTRPRKPGA
jgi:DNA-binding transcriptional LysR family regulator